MELTFKFSLETTNLIINTLADGPYKTVATLIADIQKQAQEQMAAKQPEVPQEH